MSAVDFEAWAVGPLKLSMQGKTYVVPVPDTERAKYILAAAARGEVNLGLKAGPLPPEVEAVLASMPDDEHPGLGREVWQQMVADAILPEVRDRMAYYAVFYWARGKLFADWVATILWSPGAEEARAAAAGGGASPKG